MSNDHVSTGPSSVRGADVASDAQSAVRQLKSQGRQTVESTKSAAADQVEAVADAVDSAADRLGGTNQTLANYARDHEAQGLSDRT